MRFQWLSDLLDRVFGPPEFELTDLPPDPPKGKNFLDNPDMEFSQRGAEGKGHYLELGPGVIQMDKPPKKSEVLVVGAPDHKKVMEQARIMSMPKPAPVVLPLVDEEEERRKRRRREEEMNALLVSQMAVQPQHIGMDYASGPDQTVHHHHDSSPSHCDSSSSSFDSGSSDCGGGGGGFD